MNPSLLDRVLALAPLAVLAYVLRRNESERNRLLQVLSEDRESFRSERRELMNRVQHPHLMPTVAPSRPRDRRPDGIREAEAARRASREVGTFELPTDRDDVPGANAR